MSLLVKVQASFSCTSGRVGRSGKYDLSEFRGHKVRKGCEKRDHIMNDVMNDVLNELVQLLGWMKQQNECQ